jgi:TetR/AcrR family transcriptional regulator
VAARAGVSKGTLFLYFPSKEELFKAVVRENISGRFAEWNEEFETFEGTSADMVRLLHAGLVGAHRRHPRQRHHQADDERGPQLPRLAAFYQQEVIGPAPADPRILQRGVDSGEFRPTWTSTTRCSRWSRR